MAEKVVQVQGIGNVAFPDTMSDQDISAAIRKQLASSSPTLTESRQAASTSEFDANQPAYTKPENASVTDAPLDFGIGIEKALGIDPMHPIRSTPGAIGHLIQGLAKVWGAEGPRGQLESIRGMVQAPIDSVLKGGEALRNQNLPEAMQAIGEGYTVAKPVIEGLSSAVEAAKNFKSETAADYLQNRANVNTARSMKPKGLESKATTQRIAPELSERGINGVTGNRIDKQVEQGLTEATTRLQRVENRILADVRPENQIATAPILEQIDGAIQKLKVSGTEVSGHPEAISALQKLRNDLRGLPKYADAKQVIQLRRQYDQAIQEAGGYKEAGSAADRVALRAKKGVADLLRNAINNLDPELKIANHDYSLFRDANDVVRRRQLGDVGNDVGIPGGSGVLDDVLASWAGHAAGGAMGGVIGEAVNLGRQTRGWASMKAAAQRALAEQLRPEARRPAGLLTEGSPQLGAVPDTSSVRGTAAQRGTPVVKGLLGPQSTPVIAMPIEGPTGPGGGYRMPAPVRGLLPETAGPAAGMPGAKMLPAHREAIVTPHTDVSRLEIVDAKERIARDPKTGQLFKYWTTEQR